jgi:hypothetical protein
MNTTYACLLAALAVLIILIVLAYERKWFGRGRDNFMPGDPATPKLREGVALVGGDLTCIVETARGIEALSASIEQDYGPIDMGPAYNEARLIMTGAQKGMAHVVASAKTLRASVKAMTPTYQNALSVYQGLRDSDAALWRSAQALDDAGKKIQDLVSSTDDHDHVGQPHVHELKMQLGRAALLLRQVSTCLYGLVRSVHYLGDSLQLE